MTRTQEIGGAHASASATGEAWPPNLPNQLQPPLPRKLVMLLIGFTLSPRVSWRFRREWLDWLREGGDAA